MSKTTLANVDGFTPVIDAVVQDVGAFTALVFGKVWRYCQMKDGACTASQSRIADELGVSRQTINSHISKLVEAGYLEERGQTNGEIKILVDTGKANLSIILTGGVKTFDRGCQNSLQGGVKNIDIKIEDKIQENKDTSTSTPPAPEFPQGSQSQYPIGYQTVCELAHWPDIPQNQVQAIDANLSTLTLRYPQKQALLEYCRQFAEEYYKRYPGRTSAGWLDWAVMGNIPEQKKQAAPGSNGNGRTYAPPQTAAEKRNELLNRMRQQEAERARDR